MRLPLFLLLATTPATYAERDFKPRTVIGNALPAIISFRNAWNTFHPDSETCRVP